MSDAQGREALSVIHINVQRTAKARWVKASQARGMKLTDWIIEQLENRAMKVRPIPEALASQYHGAGYALAAIAGGQPVALRYVEDAAPELAVENSAGTVRNAVLQPNRDTGGMRVAFELDPGNARAVELRVRLLRGQVAISESWAFRWTA